MKCCIFFIIFLSLYANADYFYTDDFKLSLNLSKGYALDGGDLPWYINFCSNDSIYNCTSIPGYLVFAIPKTQIEVGDYWYFSGVKFLYVGKTKDNEILVVAQKSEAVIKNHPEVCVSCLDVFTINNQSSIVSMLSIYPESLQKKTSEWRYSEGHFYLNKIPKLFPVKQIYSAEEVEKRSKSNWIPN